MTSKFAGLALAVDKPRRMTILHPGSGRPITDGTGKGAFIDVYSSDSDVSRQHARNIVQAKIDNPSRAKLSAEELESEAAGRVANLVSAWHLVTMDGQALDVACTFENARELFLAPAMSWLREQVEDFAADRGNFLKASSKS